MTQAFVLQTPTMPVPDQCHIPAHCEEKLCTATFAASMLRASQSHRGQKERCGEGAWEARLDGERMEEQGQGPGRRWRSQGLITLTRAGLGMWTSTPALRGQPSVDQCGEQHGRGERPFLKPRAGGLSPKDQAQQPLCGAWGPWFRETLSQSSRDIPTAGHLGAPPSPPVLRTARDARAKYRAVGAHPSAGGTPSPLRGTGWLLPSGSPTRTQGSGDSEGRRARMWHGPAQAARPAAEVMR